MDNKDLKVSVYRIIPEVGIKLKKQGYYETDVEGKKALVISELKKYLIKKLKECNQYQEQMQFKSIPELVHDLEPFLKKEGPVNPVARISHYIIGIIEELKGITIAWWPSTEEKDINEHKMIPNKTNSTNFKLLTYINEPKIDSLKWLYNEFKNISNKEKDPTKTLGTK